LAFAFEPPLAVVAFAVTMLAIVGTEELEGLGLDLGSGFNKDFANAAMSRSSLDMAFGGDFGFTTIMGSTHMQRMRDMKW
jgi:hypothetical protein